MGACTVNNIENKILKNATYHFFFFNFDFFGTFVIKTVLFYAKSTSKVIILKKKTRFFQYVGINMRLSKPCCIFFHPTSPLFEKYTKSKHTFLLYIHFIWEIKIHSSINKLTRFNQTVEKILWVSWLKYLFNLLQQLLSPSTKPDRPWPHRRLLGSMQAEHRIRLCTNSLYMRALVFLLEMCHRQSL